MLRTTPRLPVITTLAKASALAVGAPVIAAMSLVASARADAVTTRIETRPYYGAVVTIEQGVRVWRALPAHDRIIIVPREARNVRVQVNATTPATPPVVVTSHVNVTQAGAGLSHSAYAFGRYGAKRPGEWPHDRRIRSVPFPGPRH